MKKKVAIIGAGIIGLYLALKLEDKFKVVVFEEKSKDVFGKKSCSTLVSRRFLKFIPEASDFVENEISECHINFKRKKVILKFNPKHVVVNRESVLLSLADKLKSNIVFNKRIEEFPIGFDYAIDCSGAASAFQEKKLKFKTGLQVFESVKDSSDVVKTFKTDGGFCWIIPRGSSREYGIFEDPRKLVKEWEKFSKAKSNLKFAKIPSELYIPSNDRYTVCGDASGLTKPWSGGGLIWQLYEADILLKYFPNFKKYKKEVYAFFKPKIRRGVLANKAVHFIGKNMPFLLPSYLKYDNDFPSLFATVCKK